LNKIISSKLHAITIFSVEFYLKSFILMQMMSDKVKFGQCYLILA